MSPAHEVVKLLRSNIFCVLGTTASQQPWVTPVAYKPDDQGNIYWTSDRQALHSSNLESNSVMSLCIIDQTTASTEYGGGSHPAALYYRGSGRIVPDSELTAALQWRYPRGNHQASEFTTGSNSAIYRFTPSELSYIANPKTTPGQAPDQRTNLDLASIRQALQA